MSNPVRKGSEMDVRKLRTSAQKSMMAAGIQSARLIVEGGSERVGKLNRRISRLWLLIHALSHARPTKVSHSANYINDPATIRDISPLVRYQDPRL